MSLTEKLKSRVKILKKMVKKLGEDTTVPTAIMTILNQSPESIDSLSMASNLIIDSFVTGAFNNELTSEQLVVLGTISDQLYTIVDRVMIHGMPEDAFFAAYDPLIELLSTTMLTKTKPAPKPKNALAADSNNESRVVPSNLFTKVSEYVVDQDEAKRGLAIYLANHINLINSPFMFETNVPALLISGPSGTGKSYMVRKMAEELGLPYLEVDITQYSTTGYQGKNLESINDEVAYLADRAKCLTPIVFIDEIDKIFDQLDFTNGLQAGLLKLMESKVDTPFHPCYIFGGAFSAIRNTEAAKNTLGFGSGGRTPTDFKLTHQHLINFGMLPELVGRLGNLVNTQHLSRESLRRVLEAKCGVKEYYNALFSAHCLNDVVSDDDLETIVSKAETTIGKTGARALKIIAEAHFRDRLYY